jgi:hypothetical protein
MKRGLIALFIGAQLLVATAARSAQAYLPRGMTIYAQLDEEVTSSTRKFRVGYEPKAHVWRDIDINGVTIIEAGTPVVLRVSRLSPRGVGGRGARIEIEAVSIDVMDDQTVRLTGGYGQETPDRNGLGRALSSIVWPASFLPGRKAVLEEGAVFDMEVVADTYVELPESLIPTVRLGPRPVEFSVEVIYEEITDDSKVLPLNVTVCGHEWSDNLVVDGVNDGAIDPLVISTRERRTVNGCEVARSVVPLRELSAHFKRGINRFTVSLGDLHQEVVLNLEM